MADVPYFCVALLSDSTRRTCWVNRRVKIGDKLTLKASEDPERWWTVIWSSATPVKKSVLHQSWEVGGLGDR